MKKSLPNCPTKEEFTKEELDNFANMGFRVASKSILTLFYEMIKDSHPKEASKLKNKMYDSCMPLQLSFDEIPYKLNVCLSIAPKNYKMSIDLPSEKYFEDLTKHFGMLIVIARTFWKQFKEQNKDLFNMISDTFDELKIDEKDLTSLYFDKEFQQKITIFAYYVAPDGTPYYKNQK